MFKKVSFIVFVLLQAAYLHSQTTEELQAQKTAKEARLAAVKSQQDSLKKIADGLKGEISSLKDQLTPYPRWDKGALGTLGFNLSQFSDWLGNKNPNAFSSSFGFTGSAFVNMKQKKYFWNNTGNLVYQKTKLAQDEAAKDTVNFETTADAIDVSSLFAYKINEKFAISVMGELRTNLTRFANPGYLDLGLGSTWTPNKDLIVSIHPLNYNFVFSRDTFDYDSSLGCKTVVNYKHKFPQIITYRSSLTAFLSYTDLENFSNWTWINGLNARIWKGLGIGIDIGLRKNKQESFNTLNADPNVVKIQDYEGDHPVQAYWVFGLTYKFE